MTQAATATPPGGLELDIDFWDPDLYATRGYPHAEFTRLRRECPVYWQEWPAGRGFWVISKYEDIVEISRSPDRFSSAWGGTNIEDYEAEDLSAIQMMLVNMDPPQHRAFRRLVRTGFTPRMIKAMEAKIRHHVDEILTPVLQRGECDFVKDVATPLPLALICELLGVPREDWDLIFDLSNRLIGFDDPEYNTSLEDSRIAAMEMWRYANELAESRAGTEGSDLVRVLMNAEIDGEKLDIAQFDGFFLLLSVAGNETTRNAMTQGLLALLEHPEQMRRLWADPSLVPTAVDEFLRWNPPVMYFRRTALSDYELRGQQIKAGDKIVMSYQSANRDEEIFDNPFSFDIRRDPNEHLAFGIGEHFCLGASLARLEMTAFFDAFVRRVTDIELTGDVRRLRSNFINGIKSAPIRFRAL